MMTNYSPEGDWWVRSQLCGVLIYPWVLFLVVLFSVEVWESQDTVHCVLKGDSSKNEKISFFLMICRNLTSVKYSRMKFLKYTELQSKTKSASLWSTAPHKSQLQLLGSAMLCNVIRMYLLQLYCTVETILSCSKLDMGQGEHTVGLPRLLSHPPSYLILRDILYYRLYSITAVFIQDCLCNRARNINRVKNVYQHMCWSVSNKTLRFWYANDCILRRPFWLKFNLFTRSSYHRGHVLSKILCNVSWNMGDLMKWVYMLWLLACYTSLTFKADSDLFSIIFLL